MAIPWRRHRQQPLGAWTPYLVLATGLLVTGLWAFHLQESAREKDRLRFQNLAHQTQTTIENRVETYVGLLRAGRGLFAATGGVGQETFRTFIDRLELARRYPGVQGIGFARRVIEEGGREAYRVAYIEPLDRHNQVLLGYDLAMDPVRREALARAVDSGQAAATRRLLLGRELDETPQPGFQIFLPVFLEPTGRRSVPGGFVFGTFRARDLLEGILDPEGSSAIRFRVYDGLDYRSEALMYDSLQSGEGPARASPRLLEESALDVAGTTWGLSFSVLPGFDQTAEETILPFVLLGGLLVSLALFLVTRAEAAARHQAEEIAAELRRSEERLRESEWRLRSLVEADIIGISIGELGGRILEANDAFLELVGYRREDFVDGQVSWIDLTPEEFRPLDVAALEEMARTGRHHPYEKEYLRKDGSRVPVLVGAAALGNGLAVGFSLDLSERKDLEEALHQRVAELHEADRRKNEFLAMLGHELRNPLAPILSAVEVLRLTDSEEPRQRWATEVVERQAINMKRLIDDLLDVSRITRGTIVLRKERLEIGEVVERAAESSRALMRERQHELVVSPPPAPAFVEGDPVRIEQILVNLLNNAAKYTDPGGRVEISAASRDGQAIIRISDTGTGIPGEMLPRVFEMFMQGDRSLDRSQGGLGLGLTLVRRLVELHGGKVEADSDGPGKGSTFTVRLPALADEPQPRAEPREAGTG
jgi:PAS domain S-box-containing protein